MPREWRPYVDHFYRKEELDFPEWVKATRLYVHADAAPYGHFAQERFNMAWLFHQNTNKHHWQFWLLQKDDGELCTLPMPKKYVREMVADWAGAGRAIAGRWEVAQWYKENKHTIRIHFETRVIVEELLQKHYGYKIADTAMEEIQQAFNE